MTELLTPRPATLAKYGLGLYDWSDLALDQGGKCKVCHKLPKSGRLVIDHEHVKGWKKMPPDQRRKYVRGLLCWTCNRYFLARGATVKKMRAAADYLIEYETRAGRRCEGDRSDEPMWIPGPS
jgi:hypothetical protein